MSPDWGSRTPGTLLVNLIVQCCAYAYKPRESKPQLAHYRYGLEKYMYCITYFDYAEIFYYYSPCVSSLRNQRTSQFGRVKVVNTRALAFGFASRFDQKMSER